MSSTAGSLSLGRRPCGALSKHMFQGPEASEALLSQAGSFLLLLSAGVSLRTGGALQGGHRAHLVPPYVRQLTLAKAEKLGADVDLSCNMVAGDHVGADANMLEALAAADKPGRVEVTRRAAVLLSSWRIFAPYSSIFTSDRK